jgi:hypothetical protein
MSVILWRALFCLEQVFTTNRFPLRLTCSGAFPRTQPSAGGVGCVGFERLYNFADRDRWTLSPRQFGFASAEEDIFNPSGRFPGICRAVRAANIRDPYLAVVSGSVSIAVKGPGSALHAVRENEGEGRSGRKSVHHRCLLRTNAILGHAVLSRFLLGRAGHQYLGIVRSGQRQAIRLA